MGGSSFGEKCAGVFELFGRCGCLVTPSFDFFLQHSGNYFLLSSLGTWGRSSATVRCPWSAQGIKGPGSRAPMVGGLTSSLGLEPPTFWSVTLHPDCRATTALKLALTPDDSITRAFNHVNDEVQVTRISGARAALPVCLPLVFRARLGEAAWHVLANLDEAQALITHD